MDLNEQVGGLIIDKRVQRDSRAEALLRHCCRTVTSVLLSLFCHSLLLYCAIELFARTDGRTGTLATMTSAPGFESQHINQHASGFARRDHRGHTHNKKPRTPHASSRRCHAHAPQTYTDVVAYTDSPGLRADSPPNDSSPSPS